MTPTICSYQKFGYCRFGQMCHYRHSNEVCKNDSCPTSTCDKRHPRECCYWKKYGRCKFGVKCSYKHLENNLTDEIVNLKTANIRLENEIQSLELKIKGLLSLENRLVAIEQKSSFSLDHTATPSSPPSSTFVDNILQVDGCNVSPKLHHNVSVQTIEERSESEVSWSHAIQPMTFSSSSQSEVQECKYCDEEFSTWKDFVEFMKRFSYMCNNCLDYFPDKPWFLTKEVVMIDVGKGDNIYLNVPHMTLPPRPNF